ncbi:MAG: hypothetical protein IJU16_07520, partial [Clostridia bacterium]|nr:hypothetical protein [Clostridia bacterium]
LRRPSHRKFLEFFSFSGAKQFCKTLKFFAVEAAKRRHTAVCQGFAAKTAGNFVFQNRLSLPTVSHIGGTDT